MSLLDGWPSIVDDDGSGKKGTPVNKSWADAVKAEIEDKIHSTTNPTETPKSITDEVVNLRGNKANADARISGVIDDDGALITPASLISQAQLQAEAAAAINMAKNSTFFLWSGGLTSAPDYYTLANGTITIAGVSEGDTTRKIGAKCAKVTWGSGVATLTQKIIQAADFSNLDHLKVDTKKVFFGAWVNTSIASHARLQVDDGTLTTETSYHSGATGWEFLGGVHTLSGAATKLDLAFRVESSGSAYISGVVFGFGDVAPTLWRPEPFVRGFAMLELPGALQVGDGAKYLHFARPVRIDNLQAFMVTGPTGASLNIDFEKRENGAWQSMVTAGPLVAAGNEMGDMQPSGDYDHRCLSGLFLGSGAGFAGANDKLARLNIDQIGSSVGGSDLFLRVDGVQCFHPFEDQIAHDFMGV